MQKYVAFLRAFNVGGRTIKMEALRTHFSALGFIGVETFIASGNVIFGSEIAQASAIEERIETGLSQALGYRVETLVRTVEQVAEVARYVPFPGEDVDGPGSSLYVMFVRDRLPETASAALVALGTDVDAFHVHGSEVYWWCRTRISESPLFSGVAAGRIIKATATTRNITTVRKLAGKYGPAGSEV